MKTIHFTFIACALLSVFFPAHASATKLSYRAPSGVLLTKGSVSSLPGWSSDNLGEAAGGLKAICQRFLPRQPDEPVGADGVAGTVADWKKPCEDVIAASEDERSLRRAIERHFVALQVSDAGEEVQVVELGEFEATGSLRKTEHFRFPIYRKPDELVSVRPSDLDPTLTGPVLYGKLERGRVVPYATRAEIMAGALADKNLELAWLADPVTAFEIEQRRGALIHLAEGGELRVVTAATNGRPALHLGQALFSKKSEIRKWRGRRPPNDTSIEAAIAWLKQNPQEAPKVLATNDRLSFFKEVKSGPVSTFGYLLVPGRSLSVDARYLPVGVPLWADLVESNGSRLSRLMVSQEVGGQAWRGKRLELFLGGGSSAASEARGEIWLLMPEQALTRLPQVQPLSSSATGASVIK